MLRKACSNLLRLGCGALLVAMAAVWGPYAQLLRVSVGSERADMLLVVAADFGHVQSSKESKSAAPKHLQAVSPEGEAPAAPPVLKPVLDHADHVAPGSNGWAVVLTGFAYRLAPIDAGPPTLVTISNQGGHACPAARSGPARAPPIA